MPLLDVSAAFLSIELGDSFIVLRRAETVDNNGRSQRSVTQFPPLWGTIYPTGDNSLVRTEDYSNAAKTISVVSSFRLQLTSPGYQPDLVLWHGDYFIVKSVQDYSSFGVGMIVAECSSIDSVDLPPYSPAGLPPPFWNDNGILSLFPYATAGWPTSSDGLPPGAVWNSGLAVAVVPGIQPNPNAIPMFFGTDRANNLLLFGAADLPYAPGVINQLWNNLGLVSITQTTTAIEFAAPFWNNGGYLTLNEAAAAGWPKSPANLLPGALWSDGLAVSIVPGGPPPDPAAPPVYFGYISGSGLLALGGRNLPVIAPPANTGQLFNSPINVVAIA